MKRTLSLWLGILAFAAAPLLAQTPQPMGKIHGHVINPVGTPQASGTVSLATGPSEDKATFQVTANGEYSGEAPPGTYTLIFRQSDTPKDKRVDQIDNVKIVAGQTTEQDIDMSRPEFIKGMTEEQRKQLEEIKQKNASAMKANEVIKRLNADLKAVNDDIRAADTAPQTAAQELGAGATKPAIDAKVAEIKQAKFTDAEDIMTRDTTAKPDASILWARLGQAQAGLKKYDAAETSYKKAIELEAASKKPSAEIQGLAHSGLGEISARQGKVAEAQAAYDDAAKANPTQAAFYYKNEAIIFFQQNNIEGQVAAADKALAIAGNDPNYAILYYLKGNGLVGKTAEDPTSHKLVPPPGCMEAYQKYLELQPNGQFAGEVKGILASFNQTVPSSFKAEKKKK